MRRISGLSTADTRAAGSAPVRRLALLGALCVGLLGRCGGAPGPTVLVNVSGPPAGTTLRVTPMINGQPLKTPFETQGTGQLAFQLAAGSGGSFSVEVRAIGSDGCATFGGQTSGTVSDGTRTTLDLSLAALSPPLCPVTVVRRGQGTLTSEPAGISCGATCSAELGKGSLLKLTAKPGPQSYFAGWSGLCVGSDVCSIPVTGPVSVTADFAPTLCLGNGLCWESPAPLSISLKSVWASSPTDAWAVGELGALLHFDGTAWTGADVAISANLNAVWGAARDRVWAVGDNGTALFFDGTSWSPVAGLTATGSLTAVQGNAAGTDVWITSSSGAVYRLENGTWVPKVGAPAQAYTSVAYMAPDFVLLGDSNLNTTITVWNGAAFTTLPLGGQYVLYGMSGAGSDAAWVVGYLLPTAPVILRVTRTLVEKMLTVTGSLPLPYLRGVHGRTASDVWFVGDDGSAYRWVGDRIVRIATSDMADMLAVFSPSAGEAFAVGQRGAIRRWDGTQLAGLPAVTLPPLGATFAATASTAPDDIWAAGDRGTLLHYDGTSWSQVAGIPTGAAVRSISVVSPSEVWVAGNNSKGQGMVLRGSVATGFSAVGNLPLVGSTVSSVSAFSSTSAWIVGSPGLVMHWDGATWTQLAMPTTPIEKASAQLNGVAAVSATEAWVGGIITQDATAVRTNTIYRIAADKLLVSNPPTGLFNVYAMTSVGGVVWMAAQDPTTLRYSLLRVDSRTAVFDPAQDLGVTVGQPRGIGVRLQPMREVWVVGTFGTALRQIESGPITRLSTTFISGLNFSGVALNGPGDVTLVGDSSLILRARK